jgi:hypothetical protein
MMTLKRSPLGGDISVKISEERSTCRRDPE